MFAEWVSVAKRALARMLVIIVSLGFGIVKPRLGPALQRVVGTGVLWGVLAAIYAWLRLHHKANDSNRVLLLSEAPLSLLDSAICWWVFVSLAHTMRTLQLRRNTIKLSLYRHFTNTLIFAVISSVVFMLYSIKSYRASDCIKEWKEVWMDEAYWHILFASVLTVIMVLWRPTNNNQRYAFTPLLDNAEDDDVIMVLWRPTNNNQRYAFTPLLDNAEDDDGKCYHIILSLLDLSYWHILFASVLTVIMVLWRPTNNNQRYSYGTMLKMTTKGGTIRNDAYGVKMRGSGTNNSDSNTEPKSLPPDPSSNSLDSDLRWVEENIPRVQYHC
ncbi:hypothetical protein evm_014649 [Chilo suppressalis]|nr:hypothetical protein evm_014649 [Chilo suppressalis]